MRYDLEIDVEDLGISTEDLISLAEDNGDRLYDEDDLECRMEEEVANAVSDVREAAAVRVTALCARVKSLEDEIHSLRNDGFIEKTKTTIADLEYLVKLNEERVKLLEEDNANLKIKSVDVERIAQFVQISMRVDALAMAEAIRTGDYSA
jgi:hypothetical protein